HTAARLGLPAAPARAVGHAAAALLPHDQLLPARGAAADLPRRSAPDPARGRVAAEHRRRAALCRGGGAVLRRAGRVPDRPRGAARLRADRPERSVLGARLPPRRRAGAARPATGQPADREGPAALVLGAARAADLRVRRARRVDRLRGSPFRRNLGGGGGLGRGHGVPARGAAQHAERAPGARAPAARRRPRGDRRRGGAGSLEPALRPDCRGARRLCTGPHAVAGDARRLRALAARAGRLRRHRPARRADLRRGDPSLGSRARPQAGDRDLVPEMRSGEVRFRGDWLRAVAAEGAVPMVTWEPWAKPPGGFHAPVQPGSTLARILSGRDDDYIRSWARAAAAYGGPILLRPMQEM